MFSALPRTTGRRLPIARRSTGDSSLGSSIWLDLFGSVKMGAGDPWPEGYCRGAAGWEGLRERDQKEGRSLPGIWERRRRLAIQGVFLGHGMQKVRPVTDFFSLFLDVILSFPVTFALVCWCSYITFEKL
ncbi:hypothetical protein GW17_00020603 [Ensete ventricosum]|nr:hypothetical protein GW17_00020603 [Ensete ventricosum]RZS20418.1 hypothetical protein BHM03_00052969 [Ensete ventricosum]